jgi:hypothetical protein
MDADQEKGKNLPLIRTDDTDRQGKTFTAETRRRGEGSPAICTPPRFPVNLFTRSQPSFEPEFLEIRVLKAKLVKQRFYESYCWNRSQKPRL